MYYLSHFAVLYHYSLTMTSPVIRYVQPKTSVAVTNVGADSVDADLLTCVQGGVTLIKI